MPHESTVAHEHEQRLSKEDNSNTTSQKTDEVQNNVDEVSWVTIIITSLGTVGIMFFNYYVLVISPGRASSFYELF